MSRTPVSITAVPPDLALADAASPLGEGERELQLEIADVPAGAAVGHAFPAVAEAQAAAALEHAFPTETRSDVTGATYAFADARVDQEQWALPAAQTDADSAEDRDGAQPTTEVAIANTTEASSAEAPITGSAEATTAEASTDEAPIAEAPVAGDAERDGAPLLDTPIPETDASPASIAFADHADLGSTSPGTPAAREAVPVTPLAGGTRTLTQAIDTAAKLAADANAAAEALNNLKRLLRQGLPSPTHQPQRAVSGQLRSRPLAPAPSLLPKPPPVPAAAAARRLPVAPLPAPPPPAEPMRVDVRGFLAGFALSWAIGVVLYLFMTAG